MTLVMYDSIRVADLPSGAPCYAGYVDGRWPTIIGLKARFPGAHILSIAVFPVDDADCLDVESGDATISDIYGWFTRQQARKVWRPVIYTSAANLSSLLLTMDANGFARGDYRIWSAHYGLGPHICRPGSCGYPAADATQWRDDAPGLNRSLVDESLLLDSFFPAPPKPFPPATAIPEDAMLLKTGAGSVTPVALPVQATALRLACEDTAELTVEFHKGAPFSVALTWAQGSQVFPIPGNARCALVTRVDDGLGDVSAVTE